MKLDVLMRGKTTRKNVSGADKNFNQNGKTSHAALNLVPQIIVECKITPTTRRSSIRRDVRTSDFS